MERKDNIDRLFSDNLQNHEEKPPRGALDRLMERMDAEFHPIDSLFKRAAQLHIETPGPWVKASLDAKLEKKRRRKAAVWWYASGMAATVFLAFFAGYLSRPVPPSDPLAFHSFPGIPEPLSTYGVDSNGALDSKKPTTKASNAPKPFHHQAKAAAPKTNKAATAPPWHAAEGHVLAASDAGFRTKVESRPETYQEMAGSMQGILPMEVVPTELPQALRLDHKMAALDRKTAFPEPAYPKIKLSEESAGWFVQAHAGPMYAIQNTQQKDESKGAALFGPNMGFREQPITGYRMGLETGKFLGAHVALFTGVQWQKFSHFTSRTQLQSLAAKPSSQNTQALILTSAGLVEGITASVDNQSIQGSEPYLSADQLLSDPMDRMVQEFAFVSIPIGLRAEAGHGMVRFTASGALEPGIVVSNQVLAENKRHALEVGKTSGIRNVHLGIRAGAGFHVVPSRHWSFGLEPSLSYSLTDWSASAETNMRPLFFSANLNLAYQF